MPEDPEAQALRGTVIEERIHGFLGGMFLGPNWGRIDVLGRLGQAPANTGKRDEARIQYEEAPAIDPIHVWIREEVLPPLEVGAQDGS